MTAIPTELARRQPAEIATVQSAPAPARRQRSPGDIAGRAVLRFAAFLFILSGLFGMWLAATGNHL